MSATQTTLNPPTSQQNQNQSQQSSPQKSTADQGKGSQLVFVIALILIIPYIGFLAYLIFKAPSSPSLGDVAGTYGSIVAAVVGYYFGQKPVQDAVDQAQRASAGKQQLKDNTATTNERLSDFRDQLMKNRGLLLQLRERSEALADEAVKATPAFRFALQAERNNQNKDVDDAIKQIDDFVIEIKNLISSGQTLVSQP